MLSENAVKLHYRPMNSTEKHQKSYKKGIEKLSDWWWLEGEAAGCEDISECQGISIASRQRNEPSCLHIYVRHEIC